MPIIYRSDIESVNGAARSALATEVDDTNALIMKIDAFIGGSTVTLQGPAWNKERDRLNVYKRALEHRKRVAVDLMEVITSANKVMENYMNGFPWDVLKQIPNVNIPKNASADMIDTNWSGELQKVLINTEKSQKDAQAQLASIRLDKTADDYDTRVANYNYLNDQINTAQKIINACKVVLDYLGEMSVRDKEAYSKYDKVVSEIAKLKSLVSEVEDLFAVPTKRTHNNVVYVPTGGSEAVVTPTTDATPKPSKNTNTHEDVAPSVAPEVPPSPTVAYNTNPTPSTYTNTTNESSTTTDQEYDDFEYDDQFENNDIDNVADDIVDNNDNIIIPDKNDNSGGVKPRKNNTLRNVGLGLAGAAAVGAAGYGAYTAIKKSQENNEITDEDDEFMDNYAGDLDIRTHENDDI